MATQDRIILHSDANAFYASVECALDPSLQGKAVAVCGSQENRHGIVLAKSELAKQAGVKTGMANWQAKRLCKDLVIVPPHHEIYAQFSRALHEIYERYTDRVESFGLDECWLDVTHNIKPPHVIANELREAAKRELGITVSVGISFNKVFAKLGSDMKKPDAVTVITRENFRDKVWRLPCSDLLYCGRATSEKLAGMGVHTIGALACVPLADVVSALGKNGEMLWRFANGLDDSPVALVSDSEQAKSIGHGITCVTDLDDMEEAHAVLLSLTQEIGRKLRAQDLRAHGVQVTVRDSTLAFESWQEQLREPTQSALMLARAAADILKRRYRWENKIRALTVSAIYLDRLDAPEQLSLFHLREQERQARVEEMMDKIRERFGKDSIRPATLLGERKMPKGTPHAPPPGGSKHD